MRPNCRPTRRITVILWQCSWRTLPGSRQRSIRRLQSVGDWMTLERGSLRGFQFGRMVMLFSMMDGENEIPCAVSNKAMDELEQVAWTLDDRREEQFLRLRDRIEQCASRKFQAGAFEGTPPGIILRSIDFRD